MTNRHHEAAFETVIEAHLLAQRLRAVLTARASTASARSFPKTCLLSSARPSPRSGRSWRRCTATKTGEQILARPVQVDGREWLARDAAPRLQVLRADAARGVLQGRARAEPGTGGPLRREPARAHPAASFLAALREVPRRHAEPERHPGRHGGAEEPAHGPDASRTRAGSTSRTATRASRSSSSSAARWCTSRWIPSRC